MKRRGNLFNQLYGAGDDYHDVVATLEREGIEKFVVCSKELLQGIPEKRWLASERSVTTSSAIVVRV